MLLIPVFALSSRGVPGAGGAGAVGNESEADDEGEPAGEGCAAGQGVRRVSRLPGEGPLQADASGVPVWDL